MGSVNIKGTGSGIILELDKNVSFEELIADATLKFQESSSFLGKIGVGLLIRGRILSDEEERRLLEVIANNSKLTVNCVLKEDPETDRIFADYAYSPTVIQDQGETSKENEYEGMAESKDISESLSSVVDTSLAVTYQGSLRSGQTVTEKQSVIIMGDVKPGATVTSDGNIFVLGALRGTVYAGASGDDKAFVFAMEMDPLQIRIANAIAISPDADKGPKLKSRRFRKKTEEKAPEIAYIQNGHVVKDVYGSAFKRVNRFM